MEKQDYHQSVLPLEVIEALKVVPGKTYLDATFGGGGHTEKIVQAGGNVIALDFDQDSIDNAKSKFDLDQEDGVWVTKSGNLKIIKENFANLDKVLEKVSISEFAGAIFDLGVSSHMFDTSSRGFSFVKDGPLDMRMNQDLSVTAADLINGLNEGELYELFTKLGEVSNGRSVAGNIVRARVEKKISTTKDLVSVVNWGHKKRFGEIDPATKIFMALRIAVNDELNSLKEALPKAKGRLSLGGRLVVLSFHSLEDRIVKDFFRSSEDLKIITKKPITPTREEIKSNPRSRSVKMRVAEKV